MPQTIQEIISAGGRVIVFSGDSVIITWNLSLILQAWGHVESDSYQELNARTLQDKPDSIEAAIQAAKRFYFGL